MKLFVGLGNPGPKYAGHRHNVGYMAVDRIAADHDFGGWRSKFQGQICDGRMGSGKIMLLKPETFMNESGRAVGEAQRFHKLAPEDVVVFHDEIDLAPGKMRVKQGGGHAGHKGLRSIDAHVGNNYQRVRIGVGHPGRKDAVPFHVLKDFSKADQAWLEDLLAGISDGAPFLAADDIDKFRNAATRRMAGSAEKADAASQRPTPVAASPADGDDRSALQKLLDRFRR
ncbi:MAG: aminoacyl-tRNA hydrolase [Boseongicola sp. SB0662_bin_57]|nr:aminoacyl-tRNA hydrolase [Boseongicola sp. SB0662_bin_57]